jgi:threo-3-hydroxy-L-aspartate ammonia-lyase
MLTTAVTLDDVMRAREAIGGRLHRTPVFSSATLSERTGADVALKAELFQRTGSFKPRGVLTNLAALSDDERRAGVVGISAGNHAAALAYGACQAGIDCLVVMWRGASEAKIEATRGYGAAVDLEAKNPTDAFDRLAELQSETGRPLVHPFDHPRTIAGQGTVGLEIVEDLPDVAAVLIPIGGGGLASGVAAAVRALQPSARLIGVEPELAADARDSLNAGRIVAWSSEDVSRTISDGTRTTALGVRPFAHLSALLDDIVTVSEAEIAAAIRLIAEESRLVAEPSGALAPSALRFGAQEAGLATITGPVVAIVSGGNVDAARYREYLAAPVPGSR